MLPVEGHKNLYRDEESNAIVSTDDSAYQDYMNTRRTNADKKAEMNEMKNRSDKGIPVLDEIYNEWSDRGINL